MDIDPIFIVQNLTNTTLDSSVFSSSIEVDAILQNSFYTRPVKVFGKALHVEDAIETVYRLFQLHVGRTYQVNKTKIWTANTSLMSAILPTLKNDIQDQVRCCQDYQQTQNIANCPAKEEIEDTCPTNYARGFLWEPTKVNVTIKSNRKESCKLFTSDIEPMDQNLHVHGHVSRTCTSNRQASSVWASVNGCKCFVTAMTDVLAKMKLTVAKQYTMHYLSTLTSFVRKYYKYNTDFNIATNAQELLSQSQQQQTDLQSIYYTEFTGCLAMTTMDLISNWHSDKNCPAPDSSKVAMNNTFYNALATLLNMPKEDVLSNPAYSLENNDTLTMAIQNISMMELGRSDPCPLVGTVIPLPAFKPGSGITSPNPTTATTPMTLNFKYFFLDADRQTIYLLVTSYQYLLPEG
ncbi:uncharacterized protein TRIADDRAFT_53957 [Trichoplax adhaerens]|uniref:Uncharacterized protein n=1 Tax=Trichoplax adhaerens TaxID=10228 RepID=B3RMI2_TRIAD|nr:predicted protein [Trichoplax adhaerens]EDV27851.1 predicted protein [Trichoplax adhaerens]|eukprot:XP_002109685.1 predicted protein [Trichoplax adhaerens]